MGYFYYVLFLPYNLKVHLTTWWSLESAGKMTDPDQMIHFWFRLSQVPKKSGYPHNIFLVTPWKHVSNDYPQHTFLWRSKKNINKIWLKKKKSTLCPYGRVKKVREKSRECHNHKPQPIPDPKRKRKPTNLNKHKPNKRTESTKISSLFPKWGNHNTKRTKKYKNKMTHGKTYNKSPRRINHKATKSKTNTWTTSLERSVEQTTGGFKALLQLANFTLGPNATLNT